MKITKVRCRECGATMKQATQDPEERWFRLRRHYFTKHGGKNSQIQAWIHEGEQVTQVLDQV